jgi:hypothetical protein
MHARPALDYEADFDEHLDGAGRVEWAHEGEIVASIWYWLGVHIPTGRVLAWERRRARTNRVKRSSEGVVVAV